ncbi:hypothetical protein N4P33_23200 [Streptomyces sp. 15-116A]|uniref:hypothetical protein n=1 Tax=Streptomyces sp. 15-116A TaxID=2259035 RepID=UPI0021B32C8A|nr:hypothetical protein [Streptomyces sp. 15-116A]MCT7355037.1 hypothetical protein [Streptomyces sp. 15-116A]
MRRGLIHVLAWLLATGAAVTLSWWGVHTVMAATAYTPPRALSVSAADAETKESRPVSSSTRRPSRTPDAKKTKDAKDPADPDTPSATPGEKSPAPATSAPDRTQPPAPTPSGQVKSYDTKGGRAVFDLGETSASLVSATPGAGWSMQVWKTETWIRVEFTSGADRVSVFCTWHDGPPRVEIGTY